jgi:superfamily II DNA or RNA helicase
MVVAKINRFGYIIAKQSLSDDEIAMIKTDLTVKPFKPGKFGLYGPDPSFPVYVENGDYIGVPKYYGLEKFGNVKSNRLETYDYPKQNMIFEKPLYDRQKVIVDKVMLGMQNQRGGLLLAGCGSGKTNMAINVACQLGLKTLVIVHKEFLMNQFTDRIKSVTNCKTVGRIQGKICDTDHAFTIAMVQSLTKDGKYDDNIFKDFGLIIIDEVHHMGAKCFSRVFQKMSAKYMLGISAERRRADGLYKIINWYMGPILHAEEQKPNSMVVVKKLHYKTSNRARTKTIINKFIKEIDLSTMITNLVMIKRRTRFILNVVKELTSQGKNVLCLTERLYHVSVMYQLLDENPNLNGLVGKYIGGISKEEQDTAATKQVIIGTYSMAQEGLDLDGLDAVILCTPKTSIRQSVGRILRKDVYEEHPLVFDIVDADVPKFCSQSKTRDAYYKSCDYRIKNYDIADYNVQDNNADGNAKSYIQWNSTKRIEEMVNEIPPVVERKNGFSKKKKGNDNNFDENQYQNRRPNYAGVQILLDD